MADQPKADERPLDDRLGATGARWKLSLVYIAADGQETSDRAEIHVKEYERSLRIGRTPDLVVEMEAGRLARNIMRVRGRQR